MRIPIIGLEVRRAVAQVRAVGTAFEERTLVNQVAADLGIKAAAPNLPPRRDDGALTEIMPPFGTNNGSPSGTAGMGSDIEARSIRNDPREMWYLALPNKLSPKQVLQILRAALGGDIWQSWQLCSLMLDSWPMFRKCAHELREAASQVNYTVHPYVEDGAEPSDSALEKAATVRRAMKNFKPDPFSDEKEWTGFVYDLSDAMLNGLAMVELMWRTAKTADGPERLPRAAAWVHPRHFTFTNDGKVAVFDDDYRRLQFGAGVVGQSPDIRKFICAQFMSRSGSSLGAGFMRPLAWYWAAVVFNREWMMKTAQNHGAPFLDVIYKPNTNEKDLQLLDKEIAQGLSNRFVRHVEGTTINVAPSQRMGNDNPQRHMAELADQACAFLLLGQEGTTKSTPGKLGGDDTKENVKRERVEGLAKWLGNSPLKQFARAVLISNWGNDDECPDILPDFTEATDPMAQANRDSVFLNAKLPMKADEVYRQNNLELPEPGDLVVVGGRVGYFLECPAGGDDALPILGDEAPTPELGPYGKPLNGENIVDDDAIQKKDANNAMASRPRLTFGQRALANATAEDLDELEPMIQAAERAGHKNGEDAALRRKLQEIATRKRT